MSLLGWQVSVPLLGIMGCSPFSAGDGSKSCLHLNILPSRPSAKASRDLSAADIPNTTSSHQPQNSCYLFTIPELSLGWHEQGYLSLLSTHLHLPSPEHTLISSGNHNQHFSALNLHGTSLLPHTAPLFPCPLLP